MTDRTVDPAGDQPAAARPAADAPGHAADPAPGHAVDHALDQAADHAADHAVDQAADHAVDHAVGHSAGSGIDCAVDRGIDAAVGRLFALRRANGSWQDTLPPAAVATGSAIIALHHADPAGAADLIAAGAAWLRGAQGPDGGWGDAPDAAATLNATAIAVAALDLVAPTGSGRQVRAGLARIEAFGGTPAIDDRARCSLGAVCQHYLAFAGHYDPARLRRLPVELSLLPRRLRQKLSFTVPGLMSWGVMQARTRHFGPVRRAVNRLAEPRALAYLAGIQEYEGFVGGYEESPLMTSIVCTGLHRAGVRPDIVRRCRDYLVATVRPDGSWSVNRDLELSATTFLTLGLLDAGLAADPRLASTVDWLRRCQRATRFPPTGAPAGGWGWSLPSGWPDTDDTADALITLAGFGFDGSDPQVRRGAGWLATMQNRNGSWSCFSANAGISLDAPCTVMTAHAVTALHRAAGWSADRPRLARTVRWFARMQRPDGSIPCMWYLGRTAGTGCVLDALGGLGLAGSATAVRARDWLLASQQRDGGWGDATPGQPTVEETAWAVLGLLGGGLPADHPALAGGVRWLLRRQRADGLWRPALVGVYFLDLLYTCDHLANGYALQALGRYRQALGSARASEFAPTTVAGDR
jgi:squalene-hopene/tetraprenyl-beta-curcumene cyclase